MAATGWRRMLARGGLVALLALSAFAGGALCARSGVAESGDGSPYALLAQLARVLVLIENDYVDPVERDRLVEGAIKGMVAELDPHSSYLPASDFEVLQDDTRGEFAGIGVEVDFRNDRVTVIAPIDNSPAARSGIKSGDVIISIDSLAVQGKDAAALVKLMRGKRGTSVRIVVRRPGQDRLLKFALTREVIEVASVISAALDGNVAYLRVKRFQSTTHSEFLSAIGKLRSSLGGSIAGAVLDLRSNPGGLVDEAMLVADEFLQGGTIYSTRHRGRVIDEVRASSGGALVEGPIAILVNEFSASASELLAGALQDQHRATVIGARTFGKGSVQSIVDLPNGAGLRLTTMRYYTPGGHAIQARGILPDLAVETITDLEALGIVREEQLENHLTGEAKRDAPAEAQADAGPGLPAANAGPFDPNFGIAQKIPRDPTNGPDQALAVGYQWVRKQLLSSAGTPPSGTR